MLKVCPKCKQELDESEFNWKIKDVRRAVHCKNCARRYIREHYAQNQRYYIEKAKVRRLRLKEIALAYIIRYLQIHHCVDCGEEDIVVLEFDHKERKDKKVDISRMVHSGTELHKIVEEMIKCEVRCANCHIRKTHKENRSWKAKFIAE